MSATRTIFRRALLTSTRIRPTTTFATRAQQPFLTQSITKQASQPRFFSATMGKEGVHNLASYVQFPPKSKLLGAKRQDSSSRRIQNIMSDMLTYTFATHNSKADWESALSEKGTLVLDCFATWCGPCKVIAPQVVK